jgi:hypothetical protein
VSDLRGDLEKSNFWTPSMFLTAKGDHIDWRATRKKIWGWLEKNNPDKENLFLLSLQVVDIETRLRKLVKKWGAASVVLLIKEKETE